MFSDFFCRLKTNTNPSFVRACVSAEVCACAVCLREACGEKGEMATPSYHDSIISHQTLNNNGDVVEKAEHRTRSVIPSVYSLCRENNDSDRQSVTQPLAETGDAMEESNHFNNRMINVKTSLMSGSNEFSDSLLSHRVTSSASSAKGQH